MRRLVLAWVIVLSACGGGDDGGTPATFEELFPASNDVAGFTASGTLEVADTTQEVEDLIDGSADPFVAAGFAKFGRRSSAGGGYTVSLHIWQMSSPSVATGIYTSLLTNSLYSSNTWSNVSIGDSGRIADTGTTWWVNARKGTYHVEAKINQQDAADATARTHVVDLVEVAVGNMD